MDTVLAVIRWFRPLRKGRVGDAVSREEGIFMWKVCGGANKVDNPMEATRAIFRSERKRLVLKATRADQITGMADVGQ